MSRDAIKVDGLQQFGRNLKKLDSDLPKAVRIALNEAVTDVADDAKGMVPHRRGKASGSIKPKSTRTLARIAAGGSRAPYYPWLDFGGSVGRKRSVTRQFRKKGRYLYKAYFRARDSGAVQEKLEKALLDVVASAGIEVD